MGELLNPRPPRTLSEYHAAFPANAVPLAYFSKAIGYLQQIIPELIEVSKGSIPQRVLRVKRNIALVNTIRRKLDEIRASDAEEEIITLVQRYQEAKAEEDGEEPVKSPEGALDRFMGGANNED